MLAGLASSLPSRKSTAQSASGYSPATVTPPPNGILNPPEFANSHQLEILSALQGNELDFLSRATVADAILAMESDSNKLELIDFIASEEQGLIASTLENNACKLFNCTPAELALAYQQHHPTAFLAKVADLFSTVLHKTIPNLFAMLYPLQQFDANFRIRPIILHHFRNRVLIRLLCNFDFDPQLLEEEPELGRSLRQMFGLINIEIDDETDESESFDRIYANFLGKKAEDEDEFDEEEEEECSFEGVNRRKLGTVLVEGQQIELLTKLGETINHLPIHGRHCSLNIVPNGQIPMQNLPSLKPSAALWRKDGGGIAMPKARARTMPSKSVSFWDEESTVDV